MGVSLADLVEGKIIDLSHLKGKTIAIDTFNFLYQFLATIRGPDGSLLTNGQGEVTSHLVGLFSRTTRLLQAGIRPVFVLDGEAHPLKKKERERRRQLKMEAQKEYDIAKEREDLDAMRKMASRTSTLTPEMLADAIELIELLGCPWVRAPYEGEAQAAYMAKKGDVHAIASQDFDSLLFGAPVIIRNLSISGKRKATGKFSYVDVAPVEITLHDIFVKYNLTHEQLIVLGILVGTDFNYGGIKGIGPKKALKLVQENGNDFDAIFAKVEWEKHFAVAWQEIFDLFHKLPTTDNYVLTWKQPHAALLKQTLISKHGFAEERIDRTLGDIEKAQKTNAQKGLGDFF